MNSFRAACSDCDDDGLNDDYETQIAQQFAPIAYYDKDEPNLPTYVGWVLQRTSLKFYDSSAPGPQNKRLIEESPYPVDLAQYAEGAGPGRVYSAGTIGKDKTYYLDDVPAADQKGSTDSRDWVTYFHAYPTEPATPGGAPGLAIQYWRYYAYNTGPPLNHGGDWEVFTVFFRAQPSVGGTQKPYKVSMTKHTTPVLDPRNGLVTVTEGEGDWSKLKFEGPNGLHPVIYITKGSHGADIEGSRDGIRHMMWHDPDPNLFEVHWPDGTRLRPEGHPGPGAVDTEGGPLRNLGSKIWPLVYRDNYATDTSFLWFSGLWGEPGSGLIPSPGYPGPAYNDSGSKTINNEKFYTAWCQDMRSPNRSRTIGTNVGNVEVRECYALR